MEITPQTKASEIVVLNYNTSTVFKKYNIDFCCNGNKSLADICSEKNLEINSLIGELQQCAKINPMRIDFNSLPLNDVVDYVVNKHHKYVEEKSNEILQYLNKIVEVHGANHPELLEIKSLFSEAAGELAKHMKKEELILFPHLKKMMIHLKNKTTFNSKIFNTVKNPIEMMHKEHDIEGERFRKIAQLSSNYTPPIDACNTFVVTYLMLKDFEADLHQHIHLENNIIFPKAVELEKELNPISNG